MPTLIGTRFDDAQAIYSGAPYNFTGVVVRGPNAPQSNFIIKEQNPVAKALVSCDSDMTVNHK